MARKTRKSSQPKTDIRQDVTDQIIALMEEHGTDWVKPWAANASGHKSLATGKNYRGMNTLILAMSGRTGKTWGTYQGWQAVGGQVRKGEKATIIAKPVPVEKRDDAVDPDKVTASFTIFTKLPVFCSDQVDGWDEPVVETGNEHDPLEAGEALVASLKRNAGLQISFGGDSAFYRPSTDQVVVPELQQFDTPVAFYATTAHEITHWTSHEHRCNRDLSKGFFGNAEYAFEELVAEIGSAFLMAELGLEATPRPDHAKYLNSWIRALKDDKKAIQSAASLANKAADWVLEAAQDA